MRAIAERAGVTRQTVSLAMRDHRSLPAETRRRIQALAREMGYRPNPLFTALMEHVREGKPKTNLATIAYVTAHPTRDGWRKRGNIHLEYFAGASERAKQRGYRLEEFWAREEGMTGRRASTILLTRNIRGLLLAPVIQPRGHLSLDWPQFAVATLGYSVWRPNVHRVVVNHFHMTNTAFRRLQKLGYRRIGLILERRVNERTDHFYTAAFLDCQLRVPRTNRIAPLLLDKWDERTIRKWLERNRPDAIVTHYNGILQWIRSCGLRVPQDVGVVHLSQSETKPGWACIDVKGPVVGAAGMDLVIEQLQRNEFGIPTHPQIVMIEPSWVDGETVRTRRRL